MQTTNITSLQTEEQVLQVAEHVEPISADPIRELGSFELAYVGGGMGVVQFL